jgi:hypothetical protein
MAKPTQQELLAAHNVARNNNEKAEAQAKTKSTVPPQADPFKKPEPMDDTEHPFGYNDNNRRVAERILRESRVVKQVQAPAPLTPAEAAQNDLEKADAIDAENGVEVELSDEELERQQDADTAAALAAKQAQDAIDAETDPAKKAALVAAANGPAKPTTATPVWKQNA